MGLVSRISKGRKVGARQSKRTNSSGGVHCRLRQQPTDQPHASRQRSARASKYCISLEEWEALVASLANLGLERLQISSDSESDEPREGESQGNAAPDERREVDRRIGTSAHRQDRNLKRSRSRIQGRNKKRNEDPGKKRKERHTPEAQKRLFV